tara:strand:- start:140 stop:877 length:738 start_codon:yes stop_codon:yes gene_type:complete
MSNGSDTKRRPIPGFGWLPEWIQDFEQPLPGAEELRDQIRPGSVMDPWIEKQGRDFLRALVPQNVHDAATEAAVGMVAGPVVGKGLKRVGKALNPPFSKSRRTFGREVGPEPVQKTLQERDVISGQGRGSNMYRGGEGSLSREVANDWNKWHARSQTMGAPAQPYAKQQFDDIFHPRLRKLIKMRDKNLKTAPKLGGGVVEEWGRGIGERVIDELSDKAKKELKEVTGVPFTDLVEAYLKRWGGR